MGPGRVIRIVMIAEKPRSLWKYTILFAILAITLGLKAWLVFSEVVPFNSDEAVVALMARHILSGEHPIFFYGQAYMGSLDAYLIAAGFAIFGQQVWVIRLVQALIYAGVVISTYMLGREGLKSEKAGLIAAALLAIPPVNVTLYTTVTLGGYGEALLIGNVILLIGLRIANVIGRAEQDSPVTSLRANEFVPPLLFLGFLTGFGLWVFGLTLVFSVPTWIYLVWRWAHHKNLRMGKWALVALGSGTMGFLAGSTPWWIYALNHGFNDLVVELTGSAVAVEQTSFLVRSFNHLVNYLLLGLTVTFGLRPPWEVRWLALPLIPVVLCIWAAVIFTAWRKMKSSPTVRPLFSLLFGVILFQLGAFIFTSFGIDPSGRYFLPLAVPLALFAGGVVVSLPKVSPYWKWAALALILIDHGWGTVQSATQMPPGVTTQFGSETKIDHRYDGELVRFLKEHDEYRGYTNYWVAYPLAFLSEEELIYIPRLPYHLDFRYTARDDRFAPYQTQVRTSERVAYITTQHPALDEAIRSSLIQKGIRWQEEVIGDYRVFYDLSAPVSPEEIGLGEGSL